MAEPGRVCEVCLHAHDYRGRGSYQHLGDFLLNLPGMRLEGHTFVFEDAHAGLILDITPCCAQDAAGNEMAPGPDATGRFDRIVIFTRSLPEESAYRRFADFCFSLARWTGWPVFDISQRPLKNERALLKLLQSPPEKVTPVASPGGWTAWETTDLVLQVLGCLADGGCAGCTGLFLLLVAAGGWAARVLLHR